jgi:hypothetical protein
MRAGCAGGCACGGTRIADNANATLRGGLHATALRRAFALPTGGCYAAFFTVPAGSVIPGGSCLRSAALCTAPCQHSLFLHPARFKRYYAFSPLRLLCLLPRHSSWDLLLSFYYASNAGHCFTRCAGGRTDCRACYKRGAPAAATNAAFMTPAAGIPRTGEQRRCRTLPAGTLPRLLAGAAAPAHYTTTPPGREVYACRIYATVLRRGIRGASTPGTPFPPASPLSAFLGWIFCVCLVHD